MSACTYKPSVLLIGANENPALPILENLNRHKVSVTVAAHRRLCVGFFSRYPRRRLLCPDPQKAPDAFCAWLEDTVRKGDYSVILACGEEQTWLLSRMKPRLAPYTRVPVPDNDLFLTCRDKARTMRAADRLGIPIPKTYYPADDGLEAVIRMIPAYPVVLKPCVSNGARGISYPRSADELRQTYPVTQAAFGECIVQEFVSHTGMQYKAEVLLDEQGKVLAGGVYDKPRYYPPQGGSSTLNSTVDRPDILDLAVRFLRGIGWTGMGDCDFITDPKDGSVKLMEVNPRFTRSIKILVWAGLEFPYLLYCLALGLPVPPQFEYRKGIFLRYFSNDCVWFLRSPDRFRARPSFFRCFGRTMHEEVFSWSDPGPAMAFVLSGALRLLDRRERKFMFRSL
jgi:predicted ATP-grasp superfamily ATP-dependent carboligase